MKRLIHAAVLLTSIAMLASCNKDGLSEKDIIGNWSYIGVDYYYDGQKISNPNGEDVWCLMQDGSYYAPVENSSLLVLFPLTFTESREIYIAGNKLGNWSTKDGQLNIASDNGSMIIENGTLYITNIDDQVLGYTLDYPNSSTQWLGYDGNLHELTTTIKYAK